MQTNKTQIIETLILFGVYVILHFVIKYVINNLLKKTRFETGRRRMAVRAVQLVSSVSTVIFLTGVWGLKQNEIAVFAGTMLTVLGVAFFAQWSILSNITSSILLFFNHPIKLGDYIRVLQKDAGYEGEVVELNYFFIHIKTKQNEIITIPNSHFFEKSFAMINKPEK